MRLDLKSGWKQKKMEVSCCTPPDSTSLEGSGQRLDYPMWVYRWPQHYSHAPNHYFSSRQFSLNWKPLCLGLKVSFNSEIGDLTTWHKYGYLWLIYLVRAWNLREMSLHQKEGVIESIKNIYVIIIQKMNEETRSQNIGLQCMMTKLIFQWWPIIYFNKIFEEKMHTTLDTAVSQYSLEF